MDMNEFNGKVKPYTEGGELIFDVRVFGDRQGEAIESYLHARLMVGTITGIGRTNKHVVLLCDSTAKIPETAEHWRQNLDATGQSTEIRRAWSPVGHS